MLDANCIRCGSENLADYPVCGPCSHEAHFPNRTDCAHCAWVQWLDQQTTSIGTRIHEAAPEMYELLQKISRHLNSRNYNDLGLSLATDAIDALLTKIKSSSKEGNNG